MFSYQPHVTDYIKDPNLRNLVGDIRQPWIDLGVLIGITEFEAKALFTLGMIRRYILSANAILKDMRHLGFLSAYSLISSGVELLGRSLHADEIVRQHPKSRSGERLEAGFEYIQQKQPKQMSSEVVVATNYYQYKILHLKELRNLATHGGCISTVTKVHGDIELLHEIRKGLYGILFDENDPQQGKGPIKGAIDIFYEELSSGDMSKCDRLASAAISPAPIKFQEGTWPFDAQIIRETKKHIEENLKLGYPPISGGHTVKNDYFQLYP